MLDNLSFDCNNHICCFHYCAWRYRFGTRCTDPCERVRLHTVCHIKCSLSLSIFLHIFTTDVPVHSYCTPCGRRFSGLLTSETDYWSHYYISFHNINDGDVCSGAVSFVLPWGTLDAWASGCYGMSSGDAFCHAAISSSCWYGGLDIRHWISS